MFFSLFSFSLSFISDKRIKAQGDQLVYPRSHSKVTTLTLNIKSLAPNVPTQGHLVSRWPSFSLQTHRSLDILSRTAFTHHKMPYQGVTLTNTYTVLNMCSFLSLLQLLLHLILKWPCEVDAISIIIQSVMDEHTEVQRGSVTGPQFLHHQEWLLGWEPWQRAVLLQSCIVSET